MNQNISKILLGFSLGGIVTFAATFVYLTSLQDRINVPGELKEVMTGLAIPVGACLLVILALSYLLAAKTKK